MTLPRLVGTTTTEIQAIQSSPKPLGFPPLPYVPYLIDLSQYLDSILVAIAKTITALVLLLPPELRILLGFGILFGFMRWWMRYYIRSAKMQLSFIPVLFSWGLIEPEFKPKICQMPDCDYKTHSDWAFKRHMKRKHK
jgi:hypothetical protein